MLAIDSWRLWKLLCPYDLTCPLSDITELDNPKIVSVNVKTMFHQYTDIRSKLRVKVPNVPYNILPDFVLHIIVADLPVLSVISLVQMKLNSF